MIIGYHRIIGLSVRLCDVLFVCDRDIKRLTRDSLFHPVPSRSEGRPRQDPPGTLRVSDCLRAWTSHQVCPWKNGKRNQTNTIWYYLILFGVLFCDAVCFLGIERSRSWRRDPNCKITLDWNWDHSRCQGLSGGAKENILPLWVPKCQGTSSIASPARLKPKRCKGSGTSRCAEGGNILLLLSVWRFTLLLDVHCLRKKGYLQYLQYKLNQP